MKRLIIPFILLITMISGANGQEVIVTSSFDTSRIFIGDQIKFTVTIDKPSNLKLVLPFFKDSLCKNIEILSGPTVDSSLVKGGRVKIFEKYLITSYDSGYYQIPPVLVEIKNENGLKRFYSDYSLLEVIRVNIAPADTTAKFYDIIKPYNAPVTVGELLAWALLISVISALVWIAVIFIRKLKKSKTGFETVVIPDPAHIIAFRDLERLREEKLWQKNEIKNYYTKLTEILRQYLENRYRVYSLELTTAETLDALIKTGFKKDGTYNQLKSILIGADLVKFAKYNPEPSDNEVHFQNAWNFVLATKENEVLNGDVDEKDMEKEEEASL